MEGKRQMNNPLGSHMIRSECVLPWDAMPLRWDELDVGQQRLIGELHGWFLEIRNDNQRHYGEGWASAVRSSCGFMTESDGSCHIWADPQRRSHRILVINGARGTGKSTLLATLTHIWNPKSRFVPAETLEYPEETWKKRLGRKVWPAHVRVLTPIDLAPKPRVMHPFAVIVHAFEKLVECVEGSHYQSDACGWSDSPRSTGLATLWGELIGSVATVWPDPEKGQPYRARDFAELGEDLNALFRSWNRFSGLWLAFLECLLHRLAQQGQMGPHDLLVLPVDDLDAQTRDLVAYLEAMRYLWHPRLVYLVASDTSACWHARVRELWNIDRRPLESDEECLDRTQELAHRELRKLMPDALRLAVPLTTLRKAFDVLIRRSIAEEAWTDFAVRTPEKEQESSGTKQTAFDWLCSHMANYRTVADCPWFRFRDVGNLAGRIQAGADEDVEDPAGLAKSLAKLGVDSAGPGKERREQLTEQVQQRLQKRLKPWLGALLKIAVDSEGTQLLQALRGQSLSVRRAPDSDDIELAGGPVSQISGAGSRPDVRVMLAHGYTFRLGSAGAPRAANQAAVGLLEFATFLLEHFPDIAASVGFHWAPAPCSPSLISRAKLDEEWTLNLGWPELSAVTLREVRTRDTFLKENVQSGGLERVLGHWIRTQVAWADAAEGIAQALPDELISHASWDRLDTALHELEMRLPGGKRAGGRSIRLATWAREHLPLLAAPEYGLGEVLQVHLLAWDQERQTVEREALQAGKARHARLDGLRRDALDTALDSSESNPGERSQVIDNTLRVIANCFPDSPWSERRFINYHAPWLDLTLRDERKVADLLGSVTYETWHSRDYRSLLGLFRAYVLDDTQSTDFAAKIDDELKDVVHRYQWRKSRVWTSAQGDTAVATVRQLWKDWCKVVEIQSNTIKSLDAYVEVNSEAGRKGPSFRLCVGLDGWETSDVNEDEDDKEVKRAAPMVYAMVALIEDTRKPLTGLVERKNDLACPDSRFPAPTKLGALDWEILRLRLNRINDVMGKLREGEPPDSRHTLAWLCACFAAVLRDRAATSAFHLPDGREILDKLYEKFTAEIARSLEKSHDTHHQGLKDQLADWLITLRPPEDHGFRKAAQAAGLNIGEPPDDDSGSEGPSSEDSSPSNQDLIP